jgi:hypothetical protein
MTAKVYGLDTSNPLSAEFHDWYKGSDLRESSTYLPTLNVFTMFQPRGRTPTVIGGLLGAVAAQSVPTMLRSYTATRRSQTEATQVCSTMTLPDHAST